MSDCSQQGSWAVTSLEACEQGPIVQIVGCCGGSHREEAARSDISIGQEQVRAVLVRVVGGQLIERALRDHHVLLHRLHAPWPRAHFPRI